MWQLIDKQKWQEELLQAKEKAEESDRLKTAFLANISHEIRTPMNGILGFIDLVVAPESTEESKITYSEYIKDSGHRLLNTINEIIEISKIDSGQVSINEYGDNLDNHLNKLFQYFSPLARKKGLYLRLKKGQEEESDNILLDYNKLNSILSNLIGNAIKFTEKGFIELGYYLNQNDLLFFVKDSGKGIDKEKQVAIFDRFVQGEVGWSRTYEGTGLGLSIAKGYVDMLGGKIWLESDEGEGSIFYFKIPLKVLASKVVDTNVIKVDRDKKLNILIAEDDISSYEYLSIILDDVGEKISHANLGEVAVDFCKNTPDLDLILMDIKMPGIDGYEATRQIRQFNKDVVIIAQTAFIYEDDQEKAIRAGCNGYISKPVDRSQLFSEIQRLCFTS